MTEFESLLQRVLDDLSREGVRVAVVGGLAVSARCEPRFTRDIDIAVAVESDAEAERLLGSLHRRGYYIVAEVSQKAVGRLGVMRIAHPSYSPPLSSQDKREGLIVDLMFAMCGIEPEIVADATAAKIAPQTDAPTAQVEHLIAMKVLAVSDSRVFDMADLQWLISQATDKQIARAGRLLTLIAERGYHRQRDLQAHLRRAVKRFRKSKGGD